MNLDYADSVFGIEADFTRAAGGVSVTLANLPELKDAALDARIRYTLDGQRAERHIDALCVAAHLAVGTEIRAATFLGLQQASRTWSSHLDAHAGARRTSHELELCSNGVGLLLEPSAGATAGCTVGGRHHEPVLDLSRTSNLGPGQPDHRRGGRAAVQL